MSWPTALDVAARTNIPVTEGRTPYGLSVAELLKAAQAYAEAYCGREFDEQEVTEVHDGGTVIVVRRPPIVTVRKITVGGAELSEHDYFVYPYFVRLKAAKLPPLARREPAPDFPQAVTIVYIGGYGGKLRQSIPIPPDLREVVLEIACRWLLRIDQKYRVDRNVAALTVGNMSVKYENGWNGMEDLHRQLDKYKMVVV
jgi:hypothetical protein